MIAVTLDEWKRKLEFPNGETVILHNPKVRPAFTMLLCTLIKGDIDKKCMQMNIYFLIIYTQSF